MGVVLILRGTLAHMSAVSSFSTGQGLSSHSSTKRKGELLPPALVFKIPGALLALGVMPSLEGISFGIFYHHHFGSSQKKRGNVVLDRASHAHRLWEYRWDPEIEEI